MNRNEIISQMNRNEIIIESIKAMKVGISDAVGVERAEIFIGRNIETIITCLLAGKTEQETLDLCSFV